MKIKAMKRSESASASTRRAQFGDIPRLERSRRPELHPHERERELVRATNAAKVDRMVARPFQGALTGHRDGVSTMSRHRTRLNVLFSGSCDGELRQWHVPSKTTIASIPGAHRGWIKGVCGSLDAEGGGQPYLLSCGDDSTVKLWGYGQGQQIVASDAVNTDGYVFRHGESGTGATGATPKAVFSGDRPFTGVDCSWGNPSRFATSGGGLEIWDVARSRPVHKFEWGVDQVNTVRFNPAQHNLLASTGSDRALALYDARQETPIRRLVTAMRSNAIAWNPMEPMNLTAANEDTHCYTYDMRKLDVALCVHHDHVSAVLAIDYSPTGREFATGSYDRTVRIFDARGGKSREVYHTKRMQRVFSVVFSSDSKYVYSGSDDMNVRIWRADASMPTRPLSRKEKGKIEYSRKLIERHGNNPEVRRIHKKRLVPRSIKNATELRQVMRASDKRKDENRRKHGGDKTPRIPERRKNVISEDE